MTERWRVWLVALCAVSTLALVNVGIAGREKHITTGRVVMLELAPVDPRSLMQGDYMALRFKLENDAFPRLQRRDEAADGRVVVRIDDRGVGEFARLDDGSTLAAGEIALRYRLRNGRVKFATNAFFFKEGTGTFYTDARYGEFRVAPSGDVLLVRLRNRQLDLLGKN